MKVPSISKLEEDVRGNSTFNFKLRQTSFFSSFCGGRRPTKYLNGYRGIGTRDDLRISLKPENGDVHEEYVSGQDGRTDKDP